MKPASKRAGTLPDATYVRALQRMAAMAAKQPAMSSVGSSSSAGARRERLLKLLDEQR